MSHTTTVASSTRRADRPGRNVASAWACLLLAGDRQRLDGFAYAAESAGWEPIRCDSIGAALRQFDRWRTQLAVVDLGAMPESSRAAYRQFVERIASHERLIVVSDEPAPDDGQTELWTRQAGAWLYLPSPEFDDGLRQLFAEARQAAEKLGASPTPTPVA